MVIGSIVVYSLLGIFITAPVKNSALEAFNTAVHLANGKLEEVGNKRFSLILSAAAVPFSGTFSDFNSQVIVNYVTSAEPDVAVDPTTTNYKKIQVIITSGNIPGGQVALTTLAAAATNP